MFITFEGIDGSGKSTQARIFTDFLKTTYTTSVILDSEPFDRGVISSCNGDNVHDFMLFNFDRKKHVEKFTGLKLNDDDFLVCDRFTESSLAYQTITQNVDKDYFFSFDEFFMPFLNISRETVGRFKPDLTFFIDTPVETCLKRISERDKTDNIESRGAGFYEKVREMFLTMATSPLLSVSEKIVVIDGRDNIENVSNRIIEEFNKYMVKI